MKKIGIIFLISICFFAVGCEALYKNKDSASAHDSVIKN